MNGFQEILPLHPRQKSTVGASGQDDRWLVDAGGGQCKAFFQRVREARRFLPQQVSSRLSELVCRREARQAQRTHGGISIQKGK